MKLSAIRSAKELNEVLQNPGSPGPDPVYWVFSQSSPSWENLTILAPGRFGQEYTKTMGHYHNSSHIETYHKIRGEGVLLLQKKHLENSVWRPKQVDEVLLIKVGQDDEVKISPEYGHSWSNIGNLPLLLFDNWQDSHTASDYEVIKKLHGLAYYLIAENGGPKAVANLHYQNLPEPIWLTAQEFAQRI